jgi:hypothetical protein
MQDFALETGVPIEVVPDGTVQAVRGEGDFGSMRSRPGYYEIEQSVYNDDVRLRNELTHQIPAYLGSRNWLSPVTGNRNAAEWLEYFVQRGARRQPPSDGLPEGSGPLRRTSLAMSGPLAASNWLPPTECADYFSAAGYGST